MDNSSIPPPPDGFTEDVTPPEVEKIAGAIKTVEGAKGDPAKLSKDKGLGLYQFEPKTWADMSFDYAAANKLDPTTFDPTDPKLQDAVAHHQIAKWLGQGYRPQEIASLWNSGNPDPNVKGKGVNKYGVAYDAPGYVKKFVKAYSAPEQPTSIMDSLKKTAGLQADIGPTLVKAGPATARTVSPVTDVALPVAGATAGATIAAPVNLVAPGVASLAGAGLGGAIGEKLAAFVRQFGGEQVDSGAAQTAKDIGKWSMAEIGGQVAGKALEGATGLAGKMARPVLGRLTGAGTGAAEEALKGSEMFTKAMRGEITGEEVVQNAHEALSIVKENRSIAYQSRLAQISKNTANIDTRPAWGKLKNLMDRYGVKLNADGTFNTSRIAMGDPGRKDIEHILERLRTWGTQPGDNTAIGLDTLKRQLDDFYSDSSQARQFVVSARNIVKDLIVKNVPQYAEMTKGYAEATSLIKDIESGLMMRKSGMTGRITADQTLRRLTSSMRDNFELRRDLVNALGNESGKDIAGQVAGHAMSKVLPRGLAGNPLTLLGEGVVIGHYLNPSFWPLLLASSPRAAGEFLRMYGKALVETKGISPAIGKSLAYAFTTGRKNLTPPEQEDGAKPRWSDLRNAPD